MTSLILLKDWLETSIELWKPIQGFPDYEISNQGRVRSFKTGTRGGARPHILSDTSYVLQPYIAKTGYWAITLRDANRHRIGNLVHRLVARAFLPCPSNSEQNCVNHLNNIRSDNRVENLEWITRGDNIKHGVSIGVHPHGMSNGQSKLTTEQVWEVRKLRSMGMTYEAIGKIMKISGSSVGDIIQKRTWAHL